MVELLEKEHLVSHPHLSSLRSFLQVNRHQALKVPPVRHSLQVNRHQALKVPPVRHSLQVNRHQALKVPPVRHSLLQNWIIEYVMW
ncbi:unnamed protein product [Gadus morhua 'NCC']